MNTKGRVVRNFGSFYDIKSGDNIYSCTLRGKFRINEKDKHHPVVIGDMVEIKTIDGQTGVIEKILPRKNKISRISKRSDEIEQILFANIDRMIILSSLRKPKYKFTFIDRLTILAEKENIEPVLAFNKTDLLQDKKELDKIKENYKGTNYSTLFFSLETGEGLQDLEKLIQEGFSALIGYSGVGKSTLINNFIPDAEIKVQKISESNKKGKHTTTNYSLYNLENGGILLDTPGIKTLRIHYIDYENLDEYFKDFLPFLSECSFGDCAHIDEIGCGIKEQIGKNISEERYNNYVKIYKELKAKQKPYL